MLADSHTWLGINMVFDQWFNHTLCVRYFTETISGLFGNGPVNKIRHYELAN